MPIPYLHLTGSCAEALDFYVATFGGRIVTTMSYAQAPGMPEAWASSTALIHAEAEIAGQPLMASDFPPGMAGEPQQAVSLMMLAPDLATGSRWYDALLQGGVAVLPLGPSFFATAFGMVKDRFGTQWMIRVV